MATYHVRFDGCVDVSAFIVVQAETPEAALAQARVKPAKHLNWEPVSGEHSFIPDRYLALDPGGSRHTATPAPYLAEDEGEDWQHPEVS